MNELFIISSTIGVILVISGLLFLFLKLGKPRVILWTLTVGFVLIFLIMNIQALLEWKAQRQLRKFGVTTQATIIHLERTRLGPYVRYSYVVPGVNGPERYIGKEYVSGSTRHLNPHSQVTIKYVPFDPSNSNLLDNEKWLPEFTFVTLCIDGMMALYFLYSQGLKQQLRSKASN